MADTENQRCDETWPQDDRDNCEAVLAEQTPPEDLPVDTEDCEVLPDQLVAAASPEVVEAVLRGGVLGGDVTIVDTDLPAPDGLTVLEFGAAVSGSTPGAAAAELRALGIPAAPHHRVIPNPSWKWGPAGDAVPAPDGTVPDPSAVSEPSAVVTVIDTGLPDDGSGSVAVAFSNQQPDDQVEPAGIGLRFRGHGLFVAGVTRQRAESADIVVRTPYEIDRADEAQVPKAPESGIWQVMLEARAEELDKGGVMNISGGTYPCPDGGPPLLLAAATATIGREDIVLVASTGNEGIPRPAAPSDIMYPAGFAEPNAPPVLPGQLDVNAVEQLLAQQGIDGQAGQEAIEDTIGRREILDDLLGADPFPHVIGVGATDRNGVRASFSNESGEVAQAVGVNVESNYPRGVSWNVAGGQVVQSTGSARWDGTSFAAPAIAGDVADRFPAENTYQDAGQYVVNNP